MARLASTTGVDDPSPEFVGPPGPIVGLAAAVAGTVATATVVAVVGVVAVVEVVAATPTSGMVASYERPSSVRRTVTGPGAGIVPRSRYCSANVVLRMSTARSAASEPQPTAAAAPPLSLATCRRCGPTASPIDTTRIAAFARSSESSSDGASSPGMSEASPVITTSWRRSSATVSRRCAAFSAAAASVPDVERGRLDPMASIAALRSTVGSVATPLVVKIITSTSGGRVRISSVAAPCWKARPGVRTSGPSSSTTARVRSAGSSSSTPTSVSPGSEKASAGRSLARSRSGTATSTVICGNARTSMASTSSGSGVGEAEATLLAAVTAAIARWAALTA